VLDEMSNYKVVGEQAVPDWDNEEAATIFQQLYTAADGKVDGVLAGTQCMTVYKSATQEAGALADVAIALANGEDAETTGTTVDSSDDSEVPSILLEPHAITTDNVGDVIDDGGQKAEDVCTGDFADLCAVAGIS
jgi:D-xylose transport system substrate-binding protein